MYLVNVIYSEGLMSGREALPYVSDDKDALLKRMFRLYELELMDGQGRLEEDAEILTEAEFKDTLDKGFHDDSYFVYLQFKDAHIQFEPEEIL